MTTPATPTDMITALVRLREALQAANHNHKPIMIKISPDLDWEAIANLVTEHLTDHALARNTNQQGPPQRREFAHALEQGEIVLQGLGKTKARIEQDPLGGNTGRRAGSHALDEKIMHL